MVQSAWMIGMTKLWLRHYVEYLSLSVIVTLIELWVKFWIEWIRLLDLPAKVL